MIADRPVVSYLKDRDTGKVYGEQWYIAQPDVKSAHRIYAELRYNVGDLLRVEAGGSVQTGGSGSTCKSYVAPQGTDSDRFYSGLIWLPGADPSTPAGSEGRIGAVINKDIVISVKPPRADDPSYCLHLGYQDDNYTDNGYYEMDKGNNDQSNGTGWAWVRVTVTYNHGAVLASRPKAPMDPWWDAIDDNLLPLNPKWGFQVTHGQIPDASALCGNFANSMTHGCTTWSPTIDVAGTINICQLSSPLSDTPHGHVNWTYATYEGSLFFSDFNPSPGDGDYSMELVRSDQAGITTGNGFRFEGGPVAMDIEFDAAETIDYFDLPWWVGFHRAVDSGVGPLGFFNNWDAPRKLINGQDAIVIGLLGLDVQHSAKAELHPVYGLAIHTQSTPAEDVWQVFARNSGDEGECSQDQHFLPFNSLSFFFNGATGVVDATTVVHANVQTGTSWSANVAANGVVVTFNLPDPTLKAVMHAEIHLSRTPNAAAPQLAVAAAERHDYTRRLFRWLRSEPEEGQESWQRILAQLTQNQRETFLSNARDSSNKMPRLL